MDPNDVRLHLHYTFERGDQHGAALGNPLFELLAAVIEGGSIRDAALVWAERRARTRMQPHIEALRSDLARVLADARDERYQLVTVRASHDLALPVLQQHVAREGHLHLDIGFQGSVDALRALNDRQCLVAGFHVPDLAMGESLVFARALKRVLKPGRHKLIACSRRMQGLMLRQEHTAVVRTFPDVLRQRLRFREPAAGVRNASVG